MFAMKTSQLLLNIGRGNNSQSRPRIYTNYIIHHVVDYIFILRIGDKVHKIILCTTYLQFISSQVCTILVLNYHHRLAVDDGMPPWFRKVFLQWIPWALRMSRPGNKITRRSIYLQNKVRTLE